MRERVGAFFDTNKNIKVDFLQIFQLLGVFCEHSLDVWTEDPF